MRDYRIVLDPFQTLDVLSCQVHKKLSDHATLRFVGHIRAEDEAKYVQTGQNDIQVKLLLIDENGADYVFFCGVSTNVQVRVEGDLRLLTLDAVSGSFYLDLVPHTRVFQNAQSTYDAVLKYNEQYYQNAGHAMSVGAGKQIGDLIVQYHETDWEFAKRLASHFNDNLIPAYRKEGMHFYFGFPDGKSNIDLSQETYTLTKETDDYLLKTKNKVLSLIESDALCMEAVSREIYEIGDSFPFHGQTYYIFDVLSELDGREMVHHYKLKSKAGLQAVKRYNEKAIGASLDANIVGITRDTVQVQVAVDGIQSNKKWFPYSTVYSSPDGTGWYCMPEEGDSVRLYMPGDQESEAYIISAVHLSEDCSDARVNPDHKSLKSKYNKEVLFTPTSLVFTNNKGMSIEILDEEGIRITSDKSVFIKSDEAIQIASLEQSVSVIAPESIVLEQGQTKMTIQDEIHLDGAQVHIE